MAITTWQSPSTSYHYISGSEYPEFFTATSSEVTSRPDLKYVFKIYAQNKTTAVNELISNTKNFPRVVENLGVFNSIPIMKSLVKNTFQPTISTWTACPDSIRQYAVECQEFYNGALQGTAEKYGKYLMFKNNDESFSINDYIMHDTSGNKFLTSRTSPINIRRTDYATLRMINASVYPTTYSPAVSQPYTIIFEMCTGNGQEKYIYQWNITNPYWYTSIPLDSSSPYVLDNHMKTIAPRLLEIPVGPRNFNSSMYLNLIWVVGSDGTAIPISPGYPTPANLVFAMSNIKYYDVYAYTWPIGEVSKKMRYNFVCENYDNENSIQIQWENLQGGIDNFTFNKVNTKTNNISGVNMLRNKYQQGHSSIYSGSANYYVGANNYDRGIDRVYNEQVTTYNLITDWVTQDQCNDLESLWQSNSIFANVSGTFYPVISLTDKQIIKTTKPGLKQYQFDIQLSNIKYNS